VLLFAVEIRPGWFERGQLRRRRRVAFDLGISRARSETELFGEEIEDACEAHEPRVSVDRAGRKTAEIQIELFLFGCHETILQETRADEMFYCRKDKNNGRRAQTFPAHLSGRDDASVPTRF
jgi:hypothetical protein